MFSNISVIVLLSVTAMAIQSGHAVPTSPELEDHVIVGVEPKSRKDELNSQLKRQVTVGISLPSFADMIRTLGTEQKLNLITDSYARDLAYKPDLPKLDLPLIRIIRMVGDIYSRDVHEAGGVVIMRHKIVLDELTYEDKLRKISLWNPPHQIKVLADDPKESEVMLRKSKPWEIIDIQTTDAPLSEVVQLLNERAGWQIDLSKNLGSRRANIFMHAVNSKQFTDALTFFLNAEQLATVDGSIAVQQSSKQELQDKAVFQRFQQGRNELQITADGIKHQLYGLLSKEQTVQLISGEIVQFPISSLPKELQKKALDYVDLSWEPIHKEFPSYVMIPEHEKFSLELWPMSGHTISTSGFQVNGKRITF